MKSPVTIATSHELLVNTLCTVTMYMYVAVYRVTFNIRITHSILKINVLQNACHILVYTHDAVFISPDDTLTEGNVMDALTGVRLWDSFRSYYNLHMPVSTHDEIVRRHPREEEAAKRSLVSEFLNHHPLPSWTHIVTLIRGLEVRWDRRARKGTADMVSNKYLKSEFTFMQIR